MSVHHYERDFTSVCAIHSNCENGQCSEIYTIEYVAHNFFFNDTATTEIYTLSLHDALPISICRKCSREASSGTTPPYLRCTSRDRKSTRLNSSHSQISYAVFCLKKKKPDISELFILHPHWHPE